MHQDKSMDINVLRRITVLARGLLSKGRGPSGPLLGDTDMKFETMVLRSLFVACMLVCGLILAGMISAKPVPVQLANNNRVSAVLASAPSTCALPTAGNIVCVRAVG
jgi:hypothetical protein